MDKAYLNKLVQKGKSIREIGKEVDIGYSTVRYWLNKYNLSTVNTNKNKKKKIYYCIVCNDELNTQTRKHPYCSVKCSLIKAYMEYIKRWKQGLESGNVGKYSMSAHVRRYLFKKYDSKCCKCGWSEINKFSNTLPLVVNHIDGNWVDTVEDNLELLCPNCDSLSPTFKGLNKGKGRKDRIKYRL